MGKVVIALNQYLGHGKPLYMLLYALGIIFFSFFYTAVVFNPRKPPTT
jgi:preprotein translocase subunit SecY